MSREESREVRGESRETGRKGDFGAGRARSRWAALQVAAAACLSLLAGCGPSVPPPDGPFLLATARAAVAFAEAEFERRRPNEPATTCDECGGTGTVRSGDGLARVPCPCGGSCRCEPASGAAAADRPAPRRKRLLYFTAVWCTNCRANGSTFAALTSRGWTIGPGEENHVQTVDLDARPDLRARYGVDAVPAWVLIDGDRELRRRYGPLDPFAVGRLFRD